MSDPEKKPPASAPPVHHALLTREWLLAHARRVDLSEDRGGKDNFVTQVTALTAGRASNKWNWKKSSIDPQMVEAEVQRRKKMMMAKEESNEDRKLVQRLQGVLRRKKVDKVPEARSPSPKKHKFGFKPVSGPSVSEQPKFGIGVKENSNPVNQQQQRFGLNKVIKNETPSVSQYFQTKQDEESLQRPQEVASERPRFGIRNSSSAAASGFGITRTQQQNNPPVGSGFGIRSSSSKQKPQAPTQPVAPLPALPSLGGGVKRQRSWGRTSRPSEEESSDNHEDTRPKDVFRTAHEQLIVNALQQKGVSSSAYGGYMKKSLGGRPVGGAGSGFIPPVIGGGDNGANGSSFPSASSDATDERLKSLDPKMIELIRNEIMDTGVPIAWEDIAGLEFVKTTVMEVAVYPLLRPDIFTGLRAPPKGLLLFGPPGTGKTLIGKCIASQSNSTFFSISASSLTSKWVGEGEKMVRTLFAVARVHQPAVVFIDEIDSLLTARSDNENESSRRIKTEFLVQLDGATTVGEERILVVGATNRPQDLDEAARRRLVKRLYVPLPEDAARRQIIENLLKKEHHSLAPSDLDGVTEKTAGYSGADMANLCRDAAMGPIRDLGYMRIDLMSTKDVRPIGREDFEGALRQVKASVSDKDLELYLDWNNKYGCGK